MFNDTPAQNENRLLGVRQMVVEMELYLVIILNVTKQLLKLYGLYYVLWLFDLLPTEYCLYLLYY